MTPKTGQPPTPPRPYFQPQRGDSGILNDLVAQGVQEDDTIKIGEYEFDYIF